MRLALTEETRRQIVVVVVVVVVLIIFSILSDPFHLLDSSRLEEATALKSFITTEVRPEK